MKKLMVVCVVLAVGVLSACSGGGYKTITAQQAKTMMDQSSSYILVDVRTEQEYASGHIKGAILIPNTEIKTQAPSQLPDKKETILVYCQSGVRAASAAKDLAGMGYTNVYDMGGLNSWTYGTVTTG
ncbi:MAG: rhodanese-like domain-containing protein [Propionibacteriaceae bacterium]|nr:rhodanese-like domain-containing protein [Propionibacteriaceae bacterium]